MPISRTSIIRGPGTVAYNGSTIFDADGITAEVDSATNEIPSSLIGNIASIKTDQTARIAFTPCGQLSADLLATLFPYASSAIGSSVCGAADRPLTIHSIAGVKVTFVNAAVSKMPELYLSPVKTAFGGVEMMAALGLSKDPTDANALYKVETAAYNSGAPSPDGIAGVAYQGTYGTGSSALTIADTLDGWTVTPEVTLEPVVTDALGTIDWTITGIGCTAKCTPLGLTEAQILSALPVALGRGALIGGSDLVITGENGLTVTLFGAALVTGPLAWGNTTLRAGEIGFTAHRKVANGVPGAVFSVEMTDTED